MATREKGRKKTKQEAPQEASQQFKVTDPISMADLEHICRATTVLGRPERH